MKVLLSAYSCLPNGGSEPGIGWNWAQCLAESGHDVVVLTRATNQQPIEIFCGNDLSGPIRFVFHDLIPPWQAIYKWPLGNYIYYLLWQYTAADRALRLHSVERFDRVQHITWGSFRVPSFMGRLKIPFTFGPIGGGEDTPRRLRRGLGWRGRLWDCLRRTSTAVSAPLMRSTYADATQIVATTAETLSKIPAKYRRKSTVQQAIGIDPQRFLRLSPKKPRNSAMRDRARLELLYVGRLLPWKGVHLTLKALAMLGESPANVHLTVIGSGYDHARLKKLADRLKVDELVSWVSWMRREELIGVYSNFDLFMFPSLHDSGGSVVLEALMFGLPVVCLDLGGPGIAVNDDCGKVIQATGVDEAGVVGAIATFLRRVLADPNMLRRLSATARAHAATRSWRTNVYSVYGDSLARRPDSEELALRTS